MTLSKAPQSLALTAVLVAYGTLTTIFSLHSFKNAIFPEIYKNLALYIHINQDFSGCFLIYYYTFNIFLIEIQLVHNII